MCAFLSILHSIKSIFQILAAPDPIQRLADALRKEKGTNSKISKSLTGPFHGPPGGHHPPSDPHDEQLTK